MSFFVVTCSPIRLPFIQEFVNDDHVDVWRITADGEADIRVSQELFMSPAYARIRPECAKIADIETLVQRAENMTFTGLKAEWFEEYVRCLLINVKNSSCFFYKSSFSNFYFSIDMMKL